MKLLNSFETHFNKYLTPTQFQTLSILIGLLNQYKQVKFEKLATYFPLPILFESRRKHIQRFLVLATLSIPLIWFPIIQFIIAEQFIIDCPLVIVLDRTQWRDKNIFMISVVWYHHALPIYWNVLEKKGARVIAAILDKMYLTKVPRARVMKSDSKEWNNRVVVVNVRGVQTNVKGLRRSGQT